MTEPVDPSTLARLAEHEERLRFPDFTHADAWKVGTRIVELATERNAPIAASIYLGDQRVFHVGMAGSTADNDDWLERKVGVVRRFNASSLLVRDRFRAQGIQAVEPRLGLDHRLHTFSGGAFPLRVRSALVGVIGVSGLTDEADHDLVVEVLSEHLSGVAN
ncbi:heme-degrading domain-containing protein [Leifsonia sp. NPDC058230]|uniref:heme-degrading domain-containing protein n=1 Tax=Leifsonia sp. NPDC058230 TaxID=3346391 RepID=UPI0036DA14D5